MPPPPCPRCGAGVELKRPPRLGVPDKVYCGERCRAAEEKKRWKAKRRADRKMMKEQNDGNQ